ncbi:MAG: hypothetical protein AABY07_01365 [Nanoarchaeota archaeon]
MRISFDIGGVISKYPEIFKKIIEALYYSDGIDVYILTDMHDRVQIEDQLKRNE